jgi:hypothetical protein
MDTKHSELPLYALPIVLALAPRTGHYALCFRRN